MYPETPLAYAIDIIFRSWVTFLGTVMAHEGTHGHLGRSKTANFWWGRLALIPTLVPFTNFCKTHHLHHLHTNIPDRDPDHFMNARRAWELPFRALAMPHQWFFWLRRRGRIRRSDVAELLLNYMGIFAVYAVVALVVGVPRVLAGVLPALAIVSILLWYPFAFKTHEGFSTGSDEERSHNYYGAFMYWFSLGLSMHREHHLKPGLTWVELRPLVARSPERSWRRFLPKRDIRRDNAASVVSGR
jgi:ring-1,2-phenylacetyl-CoA epoxidase subunit PaaE